MLPISVDIDTGKNWALEANRPGYVDYRESIGFDDGQAERTYVVTLDPRPAGMAPSPPVYYPPSPGPVYTAPRPAPVAQERGGGGGGGEAAEGGEAFLTMNSIPPSTCFLDGKSLGSTPKVHVTVKPGAHTVKFVDSDDGLTKTVMVSVGAGETKAAVAKLN
jgi:eukaryotic-like serine/threonine-protein kinase